MSEDFLPYIEIVENLLLPLIEATEDYGLAEDLLRDLGYAPPSEVLAFHELSGVADAIAGLIDAVYAAIDADDQSELIKQLVELLPEVGRAVQAINDFQANIQRNFSGSPFLAETDILTVIPEKLTDYLIVRYLEDYHPTIFATLFAGGVIDLDDVEDAPTQFHVPYRKRVVNWNQLSTLVSDPIASLKTNLDDGDELLYDQLLYLLNQLGLALGLLPIFGAPTPTILTSLNQGTDLSALDESEELSTLYFPVISDPMLGVGFEVYPLADAGTGKYTGLALAIRAGAQLEIPLTDAYRLEIKASANVQDGLGLRIGRNGDISFVSSLFNTPAELAAAASFGMKFSIVPTELGPAAKILSLGAPAGTRFEIGSGSLSFGVEKLDTLDLFIEADLRDGLLLLKSEEADGFISNLLPAEGISATFSFGVGISNQAGLYFKGASDLYIRLPLHLTLGPVNIEYLGIGFGFEKDQFPLTLTSGFSAMLGPLAAVVEDLGVRAVFTVKPDRSGNLGPLDVSFGFNPPNGVGLAIDAGVVKGGGYLFFDFDREEYAGALELTFSDFLSLKAIGLITTRMPDGSKGFSLLIIITAEFTVQLGYGFVFLGAGGLLGLNRTMRLEPLAEGIRTGATANIMFPTNIVENAPRIISDLRTFFPPEEGKFLIGPMVKLGWGTPTLISIALGIIIEIRTTEGGAIERIAIVGVLKCILPDEDAAILVLQVNFIGAIDFQKKTAFFFAAIFESRVLSITIEGEMGVLVVWGDDANFLVSVGGFHPRFSPPPLPFPVPKRVSLNILNESWGKIRVEGYFAVTTNTAQFGARAELFFGFSAFKIEGHFGFDALFQFDPFYFILEISAKVSLKVFGIGCFSISLKFSLEGPTPWRAKGYGKIKILFFSFKARFDETWGERRDTTLPPIKVMPILEKEFSTLQNWQALLPASNSLLVSLRELPAPTEDEQESLVLHPVGMLRVSQRAIPLEIPLDKVGSQKPEDANRFEILVSGGPLTREGDFEESFARAQFQEMKDAKKLSSPAYEKEIGGVQLSAPGKQVRSARMTVRHVRYELVTIDTNYKRFKKRFFNLVQVLFGHFLGNNAAALSTLSYKTQRQRQPFEEQIEVRSDTYVVASNTNNTPKSAHFNSQTRAEAFMMQEIAKDPQKADVLHVIPSYEVNTAA